MTMSFLSCQNWKGIAKSQGRFNKNYHQDVFDLEELEKLQQTSKGIDGSV
jgi:hypothetical protein